MGKDFHSFPLVFFILNMFPRFFFLTVLLHRIQMESDDLKPIIPCKRSRSPSEALAPASEQAPNSKSNSNEPPKFVRQPKRQRKSKDIPAYDAAPDEHVLKSMDRSNPLSRKILKREARKVRKAGMQRTKDSRDKSALGGKTAEMDVDADNQGLQTWGGSSTGSIDANATL